MIDYFFFYGNPRVLYINGYIINDLVNLMKRSRTSQFLQLKDIFFYNIFSGPHLLNSPIIQMTKYHHSPKNVNFQ